MGITINLTPEGQQCLEKVGRAIADTRPDWNERLNDTYVIEIGLFTLLSILYEDNATVNDALKSAIETTAWVNGYRG